MNTVLDERFYFLVMKSIAGQSSREEQFELNEILITDANRKGEFARLKAEALVAKEAMVLVKATEARPK